MTKRVEGANPHASALGSIVSEKRTAAARANLERAHAAKRAAVPCTCRVARPDGTHEYGCLIAVNERRRAKYAAKDG